MPDFPEAFSQAMFPSNSPLVRQPHPITRSGIRQHTQGSMAVDLAPARPQYTSAAKWGTEPSEHDRECRDVARKRHTLVPIEMTQTHQMQPPLMPRQWLSDLSICPKASSGPPLVAATCGGEIWMEAWPAQRLLYSLGSVLCGSRAGRENRTFDIHSRRPPNGGAPCWPSRTCCTDPGNWWPIQLVHWLANAHPAFNLFNLAKKPQNDKASVQNVPPCSQAF